MLFIKNKGLFCIFAAGFVIAEADIRAEFGGRTDAAAVVRNQFEQKYHCASLEMLIDVNQVSPEMMQITSPHGSQDTPGIVAMRCLVCR